MVVSHVYVLVCISSMDAMEGDKKGPETTLGQAGCIAMVVAGWCFKMMSRIFKDVVL